MTLNYQLGDWQVEPGRNLLRRDDETVQLERKAMEVLVCLLERPDETVSVETILDVVWADRVVEENSVHQRISRIRSALGDRSEPRRYIGNIPKRGYTLLAPSSEAETSAAHNESAEITEQPPQETRFRVANPHGGIAGRLTQLNQYLLLGKDNGVYLVLCAVGFVPIAMAVSFGYWEDRVVPANSPFYALCSPEMLNGTFVGFSNRWNWLLYPLLLPLWLLSARYLFQMAYGVSENSPLATQPSFFSLREKLSVSMMDWRPTAFVITVNVILTAIDQHDVAQRWTDVASICPTGTPDWGWYSLLDTGTQTWHMTAITLWTTAEQMILVHFALITAIHVYLYNSQYTNAIYLRRRGDNPSTSYVLNLEDADRRFGLGRMAVVFDLQIMFCIFGGLALLSERYSNTHLDTTTEVAELIACSVLTLGNACDSTWSWGSANMIIRDFAQGFIVVAWLLYFVSVLRSANIKLLPARRVKETSGRVEYLKQIIPPSSKNNDLLEDLDMKSMDVLAAKFKRHDFWAGGDGRARDSMTACIFIFLIMLLPITPSTPSQMFVLLLFFLISLVCANLYRAAQRHRLRRIDETLA
ncbi:MAG: transcriptional regulator [Pseudomonadales bacterium]